MAHTVTVEATYNDEPQRLFDNALNFAELQQAMAGLARYDGLPDGPVREGETYKADVTFFGIFKAPTHTMTIERLDRDACYLQSREYSASVRRWDHALSIEPADGGALWRDCVVVEADGLADWGAARFATFLYQRRHRKRRALSIRAKIERGDRTAAAREAFV